MAITTVSATVLDSRMRAILAATAVMNLIGSATFTPLGDGLRSGLGMPPSHPLYLLTIGTFIFWFGVGYASMARSGRAERTFLVVAAGGKASFGLTLAAFAAAGSVPWLVAASGVPDLVFAWLFVDWLRKHR